MPTYNLLPAVITEDKILLWSTTDTTFAAQTISLSESISNFERIRIEYSTIDFNDTHSAIEINTDDASIFHGTTNYPQFALGCKGSSYWYARYGYFGLESLATATAPAKSSIVWSACMRANGSNTNNAYCIPTAIYGVNRIKWPTLSDGGSYFPV